MLNVLGNDTSSFYLLSTPPLYPKVGKMKNEPGSCNETLYNEVYPELFAQIKTKLNLTENNFVDTFNLLGGSKFSRIDLFCTKYEGNEECDRLHPAD